MRSATTSVVCASDHELGDPAFDDGLRRHAEGADLLILDAQFDDAAYEARRGWGHSTWEGATALGRELGVGRLLLFHHDPDADDDRLDAMQVQARQCFDRAEVAVQDHDYRV